MSKIKKVLAMVLTLAMVMAMGMTSFAADNIIGNSDDRGSITVKGIDADTGNVVVKAYPIVTAKYDKNGNFEGYENTYGLDDIENPTVDELSAIAARNDLGEGTTLKLDGDSYVATELPVGMYLISVTGAESTVYNVAVASINYVNNKGENAITPGEVTMVTNGEAWVKKSGVPTIDKYIGSTDINGNNVNIGDTIKYTLDVTPIPNYEGEFPKLNVVDTLGNGLDYVETSLKVNVVDGDTKTELTQGTHYTLGVAGREITVNFVVGGEYKLNDHVGKKIEITYDATLNNSAALNENANPNDVVLNYTKDSKTQGNDGTDTDRTYTYTFEIDGIATGTTGIITKKGEDNFKDALPGAVFELYRDKECTNKYENDVFDGSVTSDGAGQLEMTGLAAGKYYLKEVAAPDGYSVNTHVFEVIISATHNADGTLKTWSVTIDGTVAATFTINNDGPVEVVKPGFDIKNTKLANLPGTGGIGTTIFTIGGCLIMIVAAALFFASRKKAEN